MRHFNSATYSSNLKKRFSAYAQEVFLVLLRWCVRWDFSSGKTAILWECCLRPGVAFPTTSYQQLIANCLTSVLTELYNSSTPTQSPTRSLEWHVWSSSSGKNCHAVQRTLFSGVSVYECIKGFFTLSHFIIQARLRDFLS